MEKFPWLSFTDASLVFISESVGIKTMYSFDKGFDKVKGVIRKDKVQNVWNLITSWFPPRYLSYLKESINGS